MKSLLKCNYTIMSIGLIPTIISMILCIFLPDAYVLYGCSIGSILYILYRLIKRPVYQPNIVLVHGTLALIICSVIKGVGGDVLIPDRTVPLTLEILILSFSLLYFIIPSIYNKTFSYFHYKISAFNFWAIQMIAALSAIHLFISCAIYLFFRPLSYSTLYIMTHILPPLVYILCIIVNYVYVKAIVHVCMKLPFLRIAAICNGKIYVHPRNERGEEPGKLDVPIEDYFNIGQTNPDSHAQEVVNSYKNSLKGNVEPRFSLKHMIKYKGQNKTVLLYILPLEEENQIHFKDGKFVSAEEIALEEDKYSTSLMSELDHLKLVAQTWQEFQ